MKFEQIRISGYGIYHDYQVDLAPELTVIYGLNGSGKSTFLSFISALLYGFNVRGSGKRFEPLRGGIHGGSAIVNVLDRRYQITRIAGNKSAGEVKITDFTTGSTVKEERLDNMLGGLTRNVFESVFAFDLAELQRLELLSDQDLVSLLYDVGLGTNVSLTEINRYLTDTMDDIFKPRGRKPVLNDTLVALRDVKKQIRLNQNLPKQYESLVREEERISHEVQDARRSLIEAEQELQGVNLCLEMWSHWQEFLIIQEQLEDLPVLNLPERGLDKIQELDAKVTQLATEINDLARGLTHQTEFCRLIADQEQVTSLLAILANLNPRLQDNQQETKIITQRLNQLENEYQQDYNQLQIVTAEIEQELPESLQGVDLATKKGWLEELTQLINWTKPRKAVNTVGKIIAGCGWLAVLIIFYFTNQNQAVWATLGLTGLLLAFIVYEQFLTRKQSNQVSRRLNELSSKFNMSHAPDEIAVWQTRLQREESLGHDQQTLVRSSKHIQLTIEQLHEQLTKLVSDNDDLNNEWQKVRLEYQLPELLQLSDMAWLENILPQLSQLSSQRQATNAQIEQIYQQCGSSDMGQIKQLYQQLVKRQQLQQRLTELQIILETTLGKDFTLHPVLVSYQTKEQLLAKQSQLSEIRSHEQELLDEKLAIISKLVVRKELLEKNEELENLELEQAQLTTQASDLASKWLTNRAIQMVIETVSQRYEQEKQPAVLQYASDYFARITQQEYTRVYVPLERKEIKVEDKKGRVCDVTELSQGTIEQLYLALRFAMVTYITDQGVEVPVVIDDVLVNFDQHRLAQAVMLIKHISKKQQIIMLTCHENIAKLFPTYQVWELQKMS